MKIVYVANIRLPTEKAHGIQIMKMCEAFSRLGHEVELVVPNRHTHIMEDAFDYYGVERNFKIIRLPTLDLVSFGMIGFFLQTFLFIMNARKYVRQANASVIYSRDIGLFFSDKLKRNLLVWEAHTRPSKRIMCRIRKLHLTIVTISHGLKQFLMDNGVLSENIIVAHDAVDIAEFAVSGSKDAIRLKLSLPSNLKLIAYVGKFRTMGESKGVEQIIEAVGYLHTIRPDTALLLVGLNSNEISNVRTLCERAGLAGNAALLVGHIEHVQVPRYLKAADVLVMNYPNTPHYAYIMSPLKLFEYMASGTPIVTSDLPTIREVLSEKEAFIAPPGDSKALAQAMQRAIDDIDFAARISSAAQQKVTQYSWQTRAQCILNFIKI